MIVLAPATRRYQLLLGAPVVTWAVSWPVIKVGVATVPPLWFGCLRYAVATVCLFAFVAARSDLALPSRPDLRLVAISGALQMLHEMVTTPLAAGIILVAAGIRLAVIDAPRIPSCAAPARGSAARSAGGQLG